MRRKEADSVGSIEKLKWRYATKKFDPERRLSAEKLQLLKEAFNLTPLSYGLQTLKMGVIADRELRRGMLSLCWGQSQVVEASHLLVLCIQKHIGEADAREHFENIQKIRTTPEEVLAPYRQRLKAHLASKSRVENREWAVRQAYIALGNLLAVCAFEGIDACPMEGFEPSSVDAFLNLEALGLESVLLLPVGYRAADDFFQKLEKVRKSLDSVIVEF